MRRLVSFCLFFHFPTFIPYFSISKLIVFHLLKTFFRKPFVRSESSALSLHHIKTTVFTAVLVLPYSSEHAERTGIGLCQQPFDSKSELKKRLSSQSFWYSRIAASTPSVWESGRRNAVLRFQVGIAKADTNLSAFWYSRVSASLSSVRESGR